jgi:hypothetical protein
MPSQEPVWQIPYSLGADPINTIDATSEAAAERVAELVTPYDSGLLASRPTSTPGSPGIEGRSYYATDTDQWFVDTGTGWFAARDTADYEHAFSTWKPLFSRRLVVPSITGPPGAAYLMVPQVDTAAPILNTVNALPGFAEPLDPDDLAAGARGVEVRMRASIRTGSTAPGAGVSFLPALQRVTGYSSDPTSVITTLSSLGAFSVGDIQGLTANTTYSAGTGFVKGPFDLTTAGDYVLTLTYNAAKAAGSILSATVAVDYRQVP